MDVLAFLGPALQTLLTVVLFVLMAWVLASAARRILGVPVGWPRSILVAFVLILFANPGATLLLDASGVRSEQDAIENPGVALLVAALAMLWAFAAGLAVLMVLEILFPTGTLPNPFNSMRRARRRSRLAGRYLDVVRIASKHGLALGFRGLSRNSPARQERTALALRKSLEEGGVTFVKLGQMLSTRSDLLPAPFIAQLSHLQSNVKAETWPVIHAALRTELGAEPETVLGPVTKEPLAAASVAQVHLAGDRVLKIQRPSALSQVNRDMQIIMQMAGWLERTAPWARRLGVTGLAKGFADSLTEELDYLTEADNTEAVGVSAAHEGIRVPKIDRSLSTARLLVMERINGIPLGSAGSQLEALGTDRRRELAQKLLRSTIRQLTVEGVFHADLHPGNVLLTHDGGLALLDFGSVGRLEGSSQRALGLLFLAVAANDERGATDCLLELLDPPTRLDERRFSREVGQLMVRFRGGFGSAGSATMFTRLMSLVMDHGFTVPPQVAAAFRALAALEGTLVLLSPGFDVVSEATAAGMSSVREDMTEERLKQEAIRQLVALMPTLSRLPRRIDRISDALEQGTLTTQVRLAGHAQDRSFFTRLVQQIIVALLGAAAVVGAILLVTNDSGPRLTESLGVYSLLGYALFFAGFVLSLRAVTLAFHGGSKESDKGH